MYMLNYPERMKYRKKLIKCTANFLKIIGTTKTYTQLFGGYRTRKGQQKDVGYVTDSKILAADYTYGH
jgi:hypothetical protein